MGPGIYIGLVLSLAVALLLFTTFALFVLRKFGLLKGTIFGRIAFWTPLLFGALGLAGIASWYVVPSLQSPNAVYESVFDAAPLDTVEVLEGQAAGGSDFGEVWIAFRISNLNDFTGLLGAIGATAMATPLVRAGWNPPSWWAVEQCAASRFFAARNVRQWEEVSITHCMTDNTVYVFAHWID